MNRKELMGYLAPEIEVNEVVVEHGIAQSSMEDLGDTKDEIDW